MITRSEFIEYWDKIEPRLDCSHPRSPIWCFEQSAGLKSNWFVCVKPLNVPRFKSEFYHWCGTVLKGSVLCYSSSPSDEWWGFTEKDDVPIWLLRWSNIQ